MVIDTIGGSFFVEVFEPFAGLPREVMHMRLRFEAGAFVDANSIGFVQVVRTVFGGRPQAPSRLMLLRAIPEGEASAGATVDCGDGDRNPVFGLTLRGDLAGSELTQGGMLADLGRLGHHRIDRPEETIHAVLEDHPSVPLRFGDCEQTFETAAIALAGPDFPRCYGSICWGWERREGRVSLRRPIRTPGTERDTVSPVFRRAVERWNAFSEELRLLPLPMP